MTPPNLRGVCLSNSIPIQQQILSLLPSKYILNMISSLIFFLYSVDWAQHLRVLYEPSCTLRPDSHSSTKSYWCCLQNVLQIPPPSQLHHLPARSSYHPLPYTTSVVSSLFSLLFPLGAPCPTLHRADLRLKWACDHLLKPLCTCPLYREGSPRSHLGQTCLLHDVIIDASSPDSPPAGPLLQRLRSGAACSSNAPPRLPLLLFAALLFHPRWLSFGCSPHPTFDFIHVFAQMLTIQRGLLWLPS